MAQLVQNLPAMWETWVQFLGWEDPLEKGKATHSRILPWISKSRTQLSNFHFTSKVLMLCFLGTTSGTKFKKKHIRNQKRIKPLGWTIWNIRFFSGQKQFQVKYWQFRMVQLNIYSITSFLGSVSIVAPICKIFTFSSGLFFSSSFPLFLRKCRHKSEN